MEQSFNDMVAYKDKMEQEYLSLSGGKKINGGVPQMK